MKEAIELLRTEAVRMAGTDFDGTDLPNFNAKAREYKDAADLLEKLSNSTVNQVAPASALPLYAREDTLRTMAMFVGVPEKVAEHFIGLILYINELEERTSKEAST